MKTEGMPIRDRSIKVLTEGERGRFRVESGSRNKPRGLTYALAIRYKDSGQNKPNPVILRAIYRLQRKSAHFQESGVSTSFR